MAVLEIELGLKGFNDGAGQVNSLNTALSNLDSQIAKASANSNQLEKDLLALNKSFKDGAISQADYKKEQKEISSALTDTRSAIANLQAQKTSYLQSLKNENSLTITANSTYAEVQKRLSQVGKEIKNTTGAFNNQSPALQAKIKEYNDLNNKLKTFDSSLGNNQRNVGNYSGALKGSNTVSMEFARLIGDAPYGMMGIGNNLQQLTQNYATYANGVRAAAVAQGVSVSSMAIMRGALVGMLSPLALLSIGIAVVTAGWTAYTMWSQRSAKASGDASKKAKKGGEEYISSLKQLDQARIRGSVSAQTELTTLRTLYSIYNDSTLPLNKRKGAYQEMQRLYPDYFKNIKFEQQASEQLSKKYDQLTNAIIATARARASSDLIAKNSERQLLNENKITDLSIKLEDKKNKLYKAQLDFRNRLAKAQKSGSAIELENVYATEQVTRYTKEYEEVLKSINNLKTDSKLLDEQNAKLSENVKNDTTTSLTLQDNKNEKLKQEVDYREKINDIISKGENKAEVSGESGVFKEITTVENFYEGLYSNLAKYQSEYQNKYAEGTAKRLELDKQYEKAVLTLNEGMYNAIDKIVSAHNDKTLEDLRVKTEKEASQIQDALGKIESIGQTIFTGNKTEVDKQLERTIEQLKKAYEAYEKILKLQGKDTSFIEGMYKTAVMKLEGSAKGTGVEDNKYLERAARSAISGVINQTLEAFSELGKKSYEIEQKYNDLRQKGTKEQIGLYNQMERLEKSVATSFTGTIGSIISSTTKGFNEIVVKGLADSMSKTISSADFKLGNLSNETSKAIVAIGSLAGNLISSVSKPTSTVGQSAGGLISGAVAGASFGSDLGIPGGGLAGAIIGGVVGLVGGIFSAKKARKQEELQRKQLEVQQQQLEEQKRANALAYSSSIIGQMTNQGIVTGVDRNAFGDITFEINGKNLVAVMNRNLTANQRGA